MKIKNLLIILGVFSVFLIGVILIFNSFGLLATITSTTPWVDEETKATWDGSWSQQNLPPLQGGDIRVTSSYDENWGSVAITYEYYTTSNIYESTYLPYLEQVDFHTLEFNVKGGGNIPGATVDYYVWNFGSSSWDIIGVYNGGNILNTATYSISGYNHISNNLVKLRTKVYSFTGQVWIFESKVRAIYSQDVDCDVGETKCEGNNYYSCENYEWKNLGPTMGECGTDCLSDSNCQSDFYIGEKYCSNNIVQEYRDYSCINYQCDYLDIEKVILVCEFGCENEECNLVPPPEPPTPSFGEWITNIWNSIINWFKGLFG